MKEDHQKEIAKIRQELDEKIRSGEGTEVIRDLMFRIKEGEFEKREQSVQFKEKESRLKKEKNEMEDERNRLIQELEGLKIKVTAQI